MNASSSETHDTRHFLQQSENAYELGGMTRSVNSWLTMIVFIGLPMLHSVSDAFRSLLKLKPSLHKINTLEGKQKTLWA